MDVEDLEKPSSPGSTKPKRKIPSLYIIDRRRAYDEGEQQWGGMREMVFARQDDDETMVARRARVRGIFALVSSTASIRARSF